jgi:hypothetical protein
MGSTKQMKIKDIKILDDFRETEPKGAKMKEKWFYYRKNGKLESDIVVNEDGYLIDGYTSYLIAKADGIKKVPVTIEKKVLTAEYTLERKCI